MWLLFSITAPFFWAVVHILDEHTVQEIFEKPWMGVVTSSIASIMVVIILPFVIFDAKYHIPEISIIVLCFIIGILIQISQAFYFIALSKSEAGIIAGYWNIVPALLPIASYFIDKQILSHWQYFGIIVLLSSSTLLCFTDTRRQTRVHGLLLMIVASVIMTIVFLLEKKVYNNIDFVIGFFFITFGVILSGVSPLLFRSVRRMFVVKRVKLIKSIHIFLLIEFVNLLALAASQFAINIGIPSLVSAVQTTLPGYTFLISLLLWRKTRKIGTDQQIKRLIIKLLIVMLMILGVWMIY